MVLKKIGNQWALVSKTNKTKVLKWFGNAKPSKKKVLKEERRVQFFKSGLGYVKPYRRRTGPVKGYVKRRR